MRHPLVAVAAFALAALCAFMPSPASAQANNVYTVAGIYVDVTAANAASAQQAGFASAAQLGLNRLIQRVTLPAELAARGAPPSDQATLDRIVLSTDVEEERRSGTRYIGRLTVRFDPNGVRALLRQQGLSVVDARSAPELVAPIADGAAPDTAALWRQVWSEGGFADELAPLTIAPATLQGAPNWQVAAPFAQAAAATSALYAILRVQGSTASANLVEASATGQRDRGVVSAQIGGGDAAALRTALASLAQQASNLVQNDWKSRASTGVAGQRARVSASALYSDERQWEAIKAALGAAAQTLISEIRIEAVGRQGALVSFSFVGDRNALVAELARRGVQLQDTPQGPVLSAANPTH